MKSKLTIKMDALKMIEFLELHKARIEKRITKLKQTEDIK
jgi:hypothetical protein